MANPRRGRFRIERDKVVAVAIVGAAFVMTVVLQPDLTAKLLHGLGF